ncbi:hypothetical protein DXG01_016111 [Tephrocybe rancida]|nr:hypothetical protein DXG01_016111 [Tephrocybe rancida]
MADQNLGDATAAAVDKTTSPPAHASITLQSVVAATQPLYSNLSARLTSLYGAKQTTVPAPVAQPVSPKIVKSFTSLGSTGFLGSPAEIDDRLKIFRDGMIYMASTTKDHEKLNESALALLHNPLRTRPTTFLANKAQLPGKQYHFARRSESATAPTALPDTTRVFDELLASSKHVEHPNGINGVFTALATIISLSVVRVQEARPVFNETSPYLDLSPLYGANDSESEVVRAKDGRGMLSPDCFYDDRVMFHPPAVAVLLILWNRNHNYIARHLLLNNEGKKWVHPTEKGSADGSISASLLAQDDEIFRIAKDINCVQFKNVVVDDFLKVLAGVSHIGPGPGLDIMTDLKQSEKGKGYDSTIEFSLLYSRWSSLSSIQDTKAFQQTLISERELSDDPDISGDIAEMNASTFQDLMRESASRNPNRRQRNFAGLRRNSDGRFKDEDLARILQNVTEHAAGTPGARAIPTAFRPAELACLERARNWKVGTLNEFRAFLGLRSLKDFADWNPDPDVSGAAERLYQSIDALELYPGLLGEAVMEGSGLSLGYTLTYALLVDLVTLVRSDIKFTTDFTRRSNIKEWHVQNGSREFFLAGKLTHWGLKDCVASPDNGGYNTWLPKLLQRNLPRNYPYDNIYSVFPLVCPTTTRAILQAQPAISRNYSYERPQIQTIRMLETTQAISHVFNNATIYPTIYGDDLKTLSNGYGFLLGFDDENLHDRDLMMALFALVPDKGALVRYGEYFGRTATSLIKDKARKNNGGNTMSIDIVRDVINATCTQWVCATLCGLPLSDGDKVNTRHEEFGALYGYIFRNVDPEHGWGVRARALEAARTLEGQIKPILPIPKKKANPSFKDMVKDTVDDVLAYLNRILLEMSDSGIELTQFSALTFLNCLVKSNRTQAFRLGEMTRKGHLQSLATISPEQMINEIAVREEQVEERRVLANILGLAVVTSINYAQLCSQAVDFYLGEDRAKERNEIIRLSLLPPAEARRVGANAMIMGYIREAQRLVATRGLWREVAEDDVIPQGHNLPPIPVHKGERIFADFIRAHTDAREIQRPFEIDPTRKVPSLLGMGLHKCPAGGFIDQLFKAIFRLKGLHRDSGKSGRLEQIVCHPAPLKFDAKALEDVDEGPVSPTQGKERAVLRLRKKTRKWATNFGKKTGKLRESMDRVINLLFFVLVVLGLLYIILSTASSIRSLFPRRPKHATRPAIVEGDIKRDNTTCRTPTKLIHAYQIHAYTPGADGVHPDPLEYTLDSAQPHRLSVVAVGNRDLRMGVYVDDTLRGMTSRIVRNSSESCEVVNDCLAKKFSSGVVVVAPGNHTVRIEWASNGFAPNTTNEVDRELDWEMHPDRRFLWKREYCA